MSILPFHGENRGTVSTTAVSGRNFAGSVHTHHEVSRRRPIRWSVEVICLTVHCEHVES